jgi:hypothetical protein
MVMTCREQAGALARVLTEGQWGTKHLAGECQVDGRTWQGLPYRGASKCKGCETGPLSREGT